LAHGHLWMTPMALATTGLADAPRALLARYYADMARMEHASIAAFARFVLELMSLGAPAALVDGAQRAMGDEIRHAKACFALASAYAGRPLAPGSLPIEGALQSVTLRGVVATAIREACMGETFAAIEAAEAAEHATVPELRAILRQISADETRHAELGWQFLRWALDTANAADRAAILSDLEAAVEEHVVAGGPAVGIGAHGMLSAAERAAVHRAALEQVVKPLASALIRMAPPPSLLTPSEGSLLGECFLDQDPLGVEVPSHLGRGSGELHRAAARCGA
jgi:hypothetical protein